jgi:hypothetical protein
VLGRLLVVGGVAWLAALLLFAAVIQWSAHRPLPVTPARYAASTLVRTLNNLSQPHNAWTDWTVSRATSADRVMVVAVDANHPERAQQIATEIVTPIRGRYDEVLVYVTSTNAREDPEVRRIQWTPARGYVETDFR